MTTALRRDAAPTHRRLALILGALTALGPLTIDMYLPSFPSIARSLHTDVASVQLTLSTYLAGLAVGQLVYGPLSDRRGRRRPLLFGLALYSFAAIACAVAPSIWMLAAARFLQALGGCAGLVISRAVVRDYMDERESARLYSSLMLVMGLAPILAPILGGQLLGLAGWRAIFVLLAFAGVAEWLVVSTLLPESLPVEARKRRSARETTSTIGELLGDTRFLRLALAGGGIQAAMFAYITGSPFVFIELFKIPPERYGLVFGTNAFGLIVASQLNRWLVARVGVERLLRRAIVTAAVSYTVLCLAAWAGAGPAIILPAIFVGIASVGIALPNSVAAAMAPFGSHAGIASALLGTLQTTFGALASMTVSGLANGTARPMASVMLGCAALSFLLMPSARPPELEAAVEKEASA